MRENGKIIIVGIIIGVLLSTILDVIAETMISSNSVSYSNSKTSEVTVEGALNELFSAVKINEKIGNTDISAIGDTITSAINNLGNSLNSIDYLGTISSSSAVNIDFDASKYRFLFIIHHSGGYFNVDLIPLSFFSVQSTLTLQNTAKYNSENYCDYYFTVASSGSTPPKIVEYKGESFSTAIIGFYAIK